MGDSHLLHTKFLITLNADNAVQKRFEVWRSERIRRGETLGFERYLRP
jgi:hypothetical protein